MLVYTRQGRKKKIKEKKSLGLVTNYVHEVKMNVDRDKGLSFVKRIRLCEQPSNVHFISSNTLIIIIAITIEM